MQSPQAQIVSAGDMSTTITSDIVSLEQYFGYAIQAIYNGTSLDGTFVLQGSCDHQQDPEGNVTVAGNFTTITGTSTALVSASAGTILWNIADANYSYVQLVYTHASGDAGTLDAWCTKKGF